MFKFSATTRILMLAAVLLLWFGAVGWRLAWLQLRDHSRGESREKTVVLVTSRGSIYDRNGKNNPLAISVQAHSFFIDPKTVDKEHKSILPVLAGRIADVLDPTGLILPADEIREKLREPKSRYEPLGVFVERDNDAAFTNRFFFRDIRFMQRGAHNAFTNRVVEIVDGKKKSTPLFSGVHSKFESRRVYLQNSRMAHVVGLVSMFEKTEAEKAEHTAYTNALAKAKAEGGKWPVAPVLPLRGALGIEQQFEEELRGVPGSYSIWMDGRGHPDPLTRANYIPPVPGADIFLTLDCNIQALLEDGLNEAREKWRATSAWGVIQDVRTGAILAMASAPSFDPNNPGAPWRGELPSRDNLPLCVNYEPGSTMKAFTLAIALEEKVITPETQINVEQGTWWYKGKKLEDKGMRDFIPLSIIMQKSSNIASAKIALMLEDTTRTRGQGSHRRHEYYLRLFGFGRRTGIELPAEEAGILARAEKWDSLTATRVGIGHSLAVTAIQMATAYSAIANGGYLMKPHVVRRVVADNGTVLFEAKPKVVARPISEKTSAIMRGLMAGVTQRGGTATSASLAEFGYTVAGKTGTTLMPVPGGYSRTDRWTSFVGFVPAEKPVFTMIIVVEKPRAQESQPISTLTGGRVAAPVFKTVALATARYLTIPSDIDGEVVEKFKPYRLDPTPAEENDGYWEE